MENRLKRIKESLARINALMSELKKLSEDDRPGLTASDYYRDKREKARVIQTELVKTTDPVKREKLKRLLELARYTGD